MRGLIRKTLYEMWQTTAIFGFALMLVMALLTYVLPQIQSGMSEVFTEIPFVKTLITGLLGTEIGDKINAQTIQAFLWVHPVVLALIWAHEIVLCTRIPAGEIDRGTIDVLLGWPVSRRSVYLCESIAWLISGFLILGMGLLGHRFAAPAMPDNLRPELPEAMLVMTNLFAVYLAVGGVAFLVSALSDRRGRAMAITFGFVCTSFLMNFLAQFWEPAKPFAKLSVMQYYKPAVIMQTGVFPTGDVTVLLVVGGLLDAKLWHVAAFALSDVGFLPLRPVNCSSWPPMFTPQLPMT